MSITLYSGPLSLFTAKVRIALAEKAVPYKRIEVPFSKTGGYEPKDPDVLRLNPKGQVPVLVDEENGIVLWDSTVIVEYLDERFPSSPLLPLGPAERARCRMLELHSDEVLFPHVWTLIQTVFYGDALSDDEAEGPAAARTAIAECYADLDRELDGREWIGGKSITSADIAYRLTTLFASTLGAAPDPALERLAAWIARMDAVPSVQDEIKEIALSLASLSN